MDISKGGAGMFLNFVPAFIDAEESPFDLSVLPESLFEGQSAAITLTLKNPGSSPEKYEFSWSDNSAAPSLSPTNHSYTISDRTANLTVIPIDDDCLEDTMSIQAKRVSDSKIFTFEFRIQEVDRCIFLASNALPERKSNRKNNGFRSLSASRFPKYRYLSDFLRRRSPKGLCTRKVPPGKAGGFSFLQRRSAPPMPPRFPE
ncbi:hypothetical protein CH375_06985 [Leptospira ellisii]|nr:hypothetical protein CH375_06985 [Leptospira ellisii]